MLELREATLRQLVRAALGLSLLWYILANFTDLWEDLPRITVAVLYIGGLCAVVLCLLPRRLAAAYVIWLAGLTLCPILWLILFGRAEVALLLIAVPACAGGLIGWRAGLAAEVIVLGVVAALMRIAGSLTLPSTYAGVIVVGGAISSVVGWALASPLRSYAERAAQHWELAAEELSSARNQRLEMSEMQEDLLRANKELTRLSERLSVMNQLAEESRRAKEEFVANVSHELRTPLNMIIGFSEMIPRLTQVYKTELPPALLSDIAAIRRNSEHLSRLVDDVLDLSQVEAGRMALTREWVELDSLIKEAITAVSALFESKKLYLSSDVSRDLPRVFCDPTRIRQVLLNLLSNSGRFCERGGVTVRARQEETTVVISVTDTGPGIRPEDQQRLFEPFQQLDGSIHRKHGGSGLGLSIARRFVELHGGRMWLESQPDIGSAFYFAIPIQPPMSEGDPSSYRRWLNSYDSAEYRLRVRPSRVSAGKVPPRFVVLDAGGALCRTISRYAGPVEVFPATDTEAALNELRRLPAQALLINASPFAAPPMSREQLRELPFGTPAILCWLPGADEAARRLGVVDYLVKPIKPDRLLAAVAGLGEIRTILVADDDPEVLQLTGRILASSPAGYRTIQARNGARTIEMLRQRQPDALLLDLVMPGMDGTRVLEAKSQDPTIRDIPTIVISSRDPAGEPIASDVFTVVRGGGLAISDLLECVHAISSILVTPVRPLDAKPPTEPTD